MYGTTLSDTASNLDVYEPSPLPAIQPTQLAEALNPASHYDPATLALSLLGLITNAPPFPLVTRLSWCLKPDPHDWDRPDFPYIYPDLEEEGEFDAEEAAIITKRAVPDDISYDALERFVVRVVKSLGPAVSVIASTVESSLLNGHTVGQSGILCRQSLIQCRFAAS